MGKKGIETKNARESKDDVERRKKLPEYLMCPYKHIRTKDTGKITKKDGHILYQCEECSYTREGKGAVFYPLEEWRKVSRQDYEYRYRTVKREIKGSEVLYKGFCVLLITSISNIMILVVYFDRVDLILQAILGLVFFISCFASCYFRPRVENYSQEDLDRKSEYSVVKEIRGSPIEIQEEEP